MNNIEIINRQRAYRLNKLELAAFAAQVTAELQLVGVTIGILFVGDRRMRQFNRDFRQINKSTDVLSFPYWEAAKVERKFPPRVAKQRLSELGDVVIATPTAARYAAQSGVSLELEIQGLIIHGLLHLCGYDHEVDKGEMAQLEAKLRAKLLTPQSAAPPPPYQQINLI
jgi:probable rRNA maturation factor